MASQSPCRFVALVIWCGVLTINMVVLTVLILNMNQQTMPQALQVFDSQKGARVTSYIHMIKGDNGTWKTVHNNPMDSALKLENNAVKIPSNGLYLFYAQVTFSNAEGSVCLYIDQTNYTEQRAISKAMKAHGKSDDCVTITGVYEFTNSDRVKLNVTSESTPKEDADKTYWGLFLLSERRK